MTSSSKLKIAMPLNKATKIANNVVKHLERYCEQINIAGSIRREKEVVGDVEILCIPKIITVEHPFFKVETKTKLLYSILDKMETRGKIRQLLKGERYRKFVLLDKTKKDIIGVDLFIIFSSAQWGTNLLIRTGPESFSKWLVTVRKAQGFKFQDGFQLFDPQGKVINTPTESSVFKALGLPFISTKERVNHEFYKRK